jgi:hypothetical protein
MCFLTWQQQHKQQGVNARGSAAETLLTNMREVEPALSSQAALVQAQQGTRDTRPLQALQPITPVSRGSAYASPLATRHALRP